VIHYWAFYAVLIVSAEVVLAYGLYKILRRWLA
jgi:hypothetical protein